MEQTPNSRRCGMARHSIRIGSRCARRYHQCSFICARTIKLIRPYLMKYLSKSDTDVTVSITILHMCTFGAIDDIGFRLASTTQVISSSSSSRTDCRYICRELVWCCPRHFAESRIFAQPTKYESDLALLCCAGRNSAGDSAENSFRSFTVGRIRAVLSPSEKHE